MTAARDEPRIQVDHDPDPDDLERRGVFLWEVWSKGVSIFPWTYDDREVCYLLEGEAEVTPEGGEPVSIGAGDLVTFPRGLSCTWEVRRPVRKHYDLG